MLKFLPLVKPPAGMTGQECQSHYRWNHGRVVTEEAEFNRYMPKYVHNYPLLDGVGPDGLLATDWASMSEDYFYNLEAFAMANEEPCYERFREDEVRFASFDPDDLLLVATTASRVFGPTDDTIYKVWRFAEFGDGVDAEKAQLFWEMTYAAAVSRDERLRRVVTAYVQNRKYAQGERFENFRLPFPESRNADIVDEFWIKNLDVVPELLEAEQELRERLGYDEWIDSSSAITFVSEAKVLWDFGEDPGAAWSRIRRWDETSTHQGGPMAPVPTG